MELFRQEKRTPPLARSRSTGLRRRSSRPGVAAGVRAVFLATLATALSTVAACGDGGPGAPSPTVTLPPTLEPPLTPSPSPTPGIDRTPAPAQLADRYRVVFYRQPESRYPAVGPLWVADLDGDNARPLTDPERDYMFAGMPDETTLYAVEFTGELSRSLVRIDLESGESEEMAAFDAAYEWEAYVAMSPDGRWIAYGDGDSTYLFDVETGQSTVLLDGAREACEIGPAECHVYRDLSWGPDSSLLAVGKVFYEGGRPVIVDPLEPGAETEVGVGVLSGYGAMGWSPDSRALCVHGRYDEPSGLYIARAPDWSSVERYLGEYEETPGFENSVFACEWVSTGRLLVATGGAANVISYGILDLASGTLSPLPLSVDEDMSAGIDMIAFEGGAYALVQPVGADKNSGLTGYPAVIDLATGEAYAALTRDDLAAALIPQD